MWVGNPLLHDFNDNFHVELQSERQVNIASRAASLPDTEQPASSCAT